MRYHVSVVFALFGNIYEQAFHEKKKSSLQLSDIFQEIYKMYVLKYPNFIQVLPPSDFENNLAIQ